MAALLAVFGLFSSRAGAQDTSPPGAGAQNPSPPPSTALGLLPPIDWAPQYRRVGWLDYTMTGIGATATVAARLIGPPNGGPQGGVWVDNGVRRRLRASSFSNRLLAEDISDVLLGFTTSYGFFGDPLINAAWLRDSPDVAAQIFWINSEVMALTLGIQQTTSNIIGRERPYGPNCGTEVLDERTHSCEGRDRYRSYFSGHTSVPFSIATATCVNHIYLPLSGGHAWIPCTLGFAAAAASGTLRIVSDNHYATDVMTGAVVGTAVGLTIPLLHYATGVPTPSARFLGGRVFALPLFEMGGKGRTVGVSLSGVLP